MNGRSAALRDCLFMAQTHQIEREWEQQIGAERFKTFYAVLKELTDS